ncbi:PKD-like family lipoprotein [Echinicola sp. 20G]|uniref:PKD-like family lipoprotein n=1 Tax=Echinicola sp. 20G TaxID=2781961 RepID=UPI001910CBAF|nr:PKD-like family lipoprotein [Echinicola sp. 20G]
MKKILIYIFLGLLPVALPACMEDLGSYDYTEINEIDFEGIDSSYVAYQGEQFKIEPNLIFTKDESDNPDNYEYEWFLHLPGALPGDKEKFLSDQRILDIPLSVAPGVYQGYYRVKDLTTGVKFATKFDIEVVSSVYEGWMVMSDINGQPRLDMASRIEEDYKVIPDVLSYTGSPLNLEGDPGLVFCYSFDPRQYGIYVSSGATGTTKIDPDTFGWSEDLRLTYEATGSFAEDWKADRIYDRGSNSSLLVSGGNVYYYYRTYGISYGVPINMVSGEAAPYTPSPYISVNPLFIVDQSILFDEDNKRFLRHTGVNSEESHLMPEGTLFDYNIGMDLKYMGYSEYNGGEAFAVLSDNSQFHIARITQTRNNIKQVYFEPVSVPGFDQADNFTVHPDFGYLFFNIGPKVYEYDLSTKVAHEMLDYGDKEITHLEFYNLAFPRTHTEDYERQLMVATNDSSLPAESSGKLEFYNVPPVNGQITLDSELEGFGKIVSVSYRER